MTDWEMILCGVDFSPASQHALELAMDLTRRHRCQLTIAHVYEPPTASATDVLVAPPELFDQAVREAERELERLRAQAAAATDRPVRSEILMGRPAETLVQWAREHPCDLIVVATHGRSGLKRLVLGSVAEKVVRAAPCSVLVAR
ncbi:universal stress protein [Anaeromyxobacter diazotrophicus]|uniref:Universal stress protein n=1 Tax=Anaeromyxobacter diazotrophicus TaxID=2590199 RepID=A0A7I9VIM6_9BACT|nr:universal stress protein [Anaeromyxobacter diazotrophicus]GEJ55990.1 universal stress protein [Anaeromyxobacter diazotrophicus]